jgi:glyoxylase-like metal-dependent hydrolase (beta-lactamase superfamily II)
MKTQKSFVVTLWLLLFVGFSLAQTPSPAPVRLDKISDRLYELLDGRGSRGGAYLGDQFVLVIDAKMDKPSVEQTLAALKQLSHKPVRYLINTHSDRDHVGGNVFFPEGITIISQENCRAEFFHPGRDGKPSEWNSPELSRFLPSITFRDKLVIYDGPRRVELWYFGVGHTTGDTVVYFPEEKAAFLADQLFLSRPQLIHAYKGGNSFEHVKTLEKMLETLDATRFYSGHSEPATREQVRGHIAEMKAMQQKVRASIEQGKELESLKADFKKEEAPLVETIYNEVKKPSK